MTGERILTCAKKLGTGPYVADSVTDTEIHLHKNTSYWNGSPKVDHLIVKAVTDGDAMTAAL